MNVKFAVISSKFGFRIEITFYDPRSQQVYRTEKHPRFFRNREDASQVAEGMHLDFLESTIKEINASKKAPSKRRGSKRNPNTRTGHLVAGVMIWAN